MAESSDSRPARLRPLRDVIREDGLSASKVFGQNYLLDLNITRKIVRVASNIKGRPVLEIGPGPGGLSRAILEAEPDHLWVIEKDARFSGALNELENAYPGQLSIAFADALDVAETNLIGDTRDVIVMANLPYNISTQLLLKWVLQAQWPPWWSELILMFQKEVAERLLSPHGKKSYGRLSVMTQWRTQVTKAFDVPPSAFVPPPKVTSTVVKLVPNPDSKSQELSAALEFVVRHAFGQRRKMIKSSLGAAVTGLPQILEELGLSASARPEQFTVEDYVRISERLAKRGHSLRA